MQSQDIEEIKAAIFEQAYHACTQVRCGAAQVMAARVSKGHLLVQLRGWGGWHEVSAVSIERPKLCPTGACDIDAEGAG